MVGTELLDLYLASDGSEFDAEDADATASSGEGSFGEHSTGGGTSSGTASSSPAMSMARAASRTVPGGSGIGSGAVPAAGFQRAC